MSDIYVHLKAANEIYNNSQPSIKSIIEVNRNAFNVGAQGPDFLFYHRIFPWTATSKLKKFAQKIHTKEINNFFISGFNIIKQTKNQEVKILLTSYFYGFLTHYAIDTQTHPYIFYYSGHEGGYNHKYFECLLDSNMAKLTKNNFAPTHKKVKLKDQDKNHIAVFMNQLISEVFKLDASVKEIDESFGDMVMVLALMRDPLHIKTPILKLIDKITHSNGKIKTGIFPRILDSSVDYFNLQHEEWYHPCAPHTPSTTSFLDLVELAEDFGGELLIAAENYITSSITQVEFESIIKNLGYDKGLNVDTAIKMTKSKKMVQFK